MITDVFSSGYQIAIDNFSFLVQGVGQSVKNEWFFAVITIEIFVLSVMTFHVSRNITRITATCSSLIAPSLPNHKLFNFLLRSMYAKS